MPTVATTTRTPGGGDALDDEEQSCVPSAAGIGGSSSAGESLADPPETDHADGASSALTDPEQSHGGGETSAFSEGGTDAQTDGAPTHSHISFASSTRAVVGQNHSNFSTGETQVYAVDGEGRAWYSIGDRGEPCVVLEDPLVPAAIPEATRNIGEWTTVATVCVATPPEVPFMLDAESCGPNLLLSNLNLTVTNTGRKKWSAVRTTLGFASGVHSWKVRIDRSGSDPHTLSHRLTL